MRSLWDFDDPAASLARFRAARSTADAHTAALLDTQIARALGLQAHFEEGHAVLDALQPGDPELDARVALERGRLRRSADEPDVARPLFERAVQIAHDAGLAELEVDALHMVALVVDPQDRVAANEHALSVALAAADPAARGWEASLLNNLGMAHSEHGDWPAALAAFERALAVRRRGRDDDATHVARWMVAWALRRLGRRDEALAAQLSLRSDLAAAGKHDRDVEAEIALLEQ